MNLKLMMFVTSFVATPVLAGNIMGNLVAKDIKAGPFQCSLWKSEDGFPDDKTKAMQVVQGSERSGEMICEFLNVEKGDYAISASQDLNANGKLDKNWVGIPKEPWGTTNNVRPSFRAPTFEESKFSFEGDTLKINFDVIQ